jgi:hypothetical protein
VFFLYQYLMHRENNSNDNYKVLGELKKIKK